MSPPEPDAPPAPTPDEPPRFDPGPALPTDPRTAPEYHRVDLRRLTSAERRSLVPLAKLPLLWLARLLGQPARAVMGMPSPRPLRDNLCEPADFSPPVLAALENSRAACEALGFGEPLYYTSKLSLAPVELGRCLLREPSGESVATLTAARGFQNTALTGVNVSFCTALADGRYLVTSNSRAHFNPPPGEEALRRPGVSPAMLLQLHRGRLETERAAGNPPLPIRTFEQLADMYERGEWRGHAFNIARGVYVPLTPAEVAEARAQRDAGERAMAAAGNSRTTGQEAQAILAALARREGPAASPAVARSLLLLGISLAVFVWLARLRWALDWTWLALLVGVLLFHETGHYVAMRAFGYRNLRMFFIPLFGAAVSGLDRRAAGWKKALVALAGPLPGIALGAALWVAYVRLGAGGVGGGGGGHDLAVRAALILLAVNAFNLLPLVPLDGGRFFDETLFSRHPLLRAVFWALAGLGLLWLAYERNSGALVLLGVMMLPGARHLLRVNRVVRRLRAAGIPLTEPSSGSPDEDPVRPEALPPLLDALKDGRSDKPSQRLLVREALTVIDQVRARPPGFAATLGLLGLYGAGCALAVWVLAPLAPAMWHGQHGGRHRRVEMARPTPDPAEE